MTDTNKQLVDRYWARDETVLASVSALYGSYLFTVANNILMNAEDSEESVNDTWLSSWNSIPPHRPQILLSFLVKITREHAIDKWRQRRADKRGGDQCALSLDELGEVVAGLERPDDAVTGQALHELISDFLVRQRPVARQAFLFRYFYCLKVSEIARLLGRSEGGINSLLHRTREKLRSELISSGWLCSGENTQ
ncbi:MAG: RNA polymerase sigma factor [Saccharofermentanales bacterium]|jgi:RNA polymerase sigma factor (sigma-70 family)